MAVEPEDDELLLDDQVDEQETDEAELEETGEEAPEGEESEEFEVQFGDEAAPASGERETGLVKHLREEIRKRDQRLAEAEKFRPQQQAIEVGEKPTLASCEYDEERYETELDAWRDRKAAAKRQQTDAQAEARKAQEQWQSELQGHEAKRAALKFADAAEVEEIATAALSHVQQAVIVKVADNSAQLLYALGKHPAKLAELSQITDPLKMAAAVAKLEGALKVMPKRRASEPEQIASGSASVTLGSDKTLERLEKEAEKTGDRSKVIAWKRQQRTKAAA